MCLGHLTLSLQGVQMSSYHHLPQKIHKRFRQRNEEIYKNTKALHMLLVIAHIGYSHILLLSIVYKHIKHIEDWVASIYKWQVVLWNEKQNHIANKNINKNTSVKMYVVNAIILHIITQVSFGPTPNMDLIHGGAYKNQ